jgi:hypothetical protein
VNGELEMILDRMEQQSEVQPVLPQGTTARQALEMEMRGEIELTPRQHNAAKILIEYQEPRLSAVAVGHMDKSSFAHMLDRAIERSKAPYVPKPALLPPPEQHPASELKGNFPMRRRNLR